MEELQKELEISLEARDRLIRARTRLQNEFSKTSSRLIEIESAIPELMVSTALDEAPVGKLETLKAERKILREAAQDPAQALKIIEARIQNTSETITTIQQKISMLVHKQRYQAARAVITVKGFYTSIESEELECLASNSLEQRDFKLFTQAVDDYRYRRELHGQACGFPGFAYLSETIEA